MVYIGAVSNETIGKLEKAAGEKVFTRNMQYAFSISYDDIRHIEKHYKTDAEILGAIKKIYGMLDGFDDLEVKRKNGQTRLVLQKSFEDGDYLTVNIVGNKRRTVDLVTLYITKFAKENNGRGLTASNGAKPVEQVRVSPTVDYIVDENRGDVKTKFDLRGGDIQSKREVLIDMLDNQDLSAADRNRLELYRKKVSNLQANEDTLAQLRGEYEALKALSA